MFSTLMTVMRGEVRKTERQFERQNAITILEQKIEDATSAQAQAKQRLAGLILKERNDTRTLTSLRGQASELETRIEKALKSDLTALAEDAAGHLARLERDIDRLEKSLARNQLAVERLRRLIDAGQTRLLELKQGLSTAQSVAAERRTTADLSGDITGIAALVEGERVLTDFLDQPDVFEQMEILEEINAESAPDGILDRLAAAGCGTPSPHASDTVLERIRSRIQDEKEQ
ncbi:MAG: PspA/IM30 family protein [Maricaulis sp.]|uniref:PspA/IM30 family protein n=1 Tax=Maricaulis sp. TaxID=1486257 RepID=UPI001B2D2E9D|nr:PspA/IM30 family protein [Maricaulis sp.]MBO6730000.1 PspA/IM30 family protein [Maricaulis sp.]MBO6846624.1 PspA/IM30 family protein [Maricaulis sp.]MBO6877139.1 PspA/IM30 family protein [Maricaulis sp.]MDM7983440.1 PspA/IM30 family protein [Maricaulis sp.]